MNRFIAWPLGSLVLAGLVAPANAQQQNPFHWATRSTASPYLSYAPPSVPGGPPVLTWVVPGPNTAAVTQTAANASPAPARQVAPAPAPSKPVVKPQLQLTTAPAGSPSVKVAAPTIPPRAPLALPKAEAAAAPRGRLMTSLLQAEPTQPAPAAAAPPPAAAAPLDLVDDGAAPALRVLADLGFLLVRPYWKNNPAFLVSNAALPSVVRQQEFAYSEQFAPQLSLEALADNGLGMRLGWWRLDVSDTQTSSAAFTTSATPLGVGLGTFVGAAGDTFIAFSNLRLSVVDLEAMQNLGTGPWALTVAGGVRYAHLAQEYDVVQSSELLGPSALISGHNFNGFGPTAYVKGARLLGPTGIALYGSARGALLFGRAKQSAAANNALVGAVDAATSAADVLPVVELELGAGWRTNLGRLGLFGQVGVASQTWFGAGNASRSTLQQNPVFGATAVPNTATTDDDLGLFGLSCRLGLDY